jgi:hypothetical protein
MKDKKNSNIFANLIKSIDYFAVTFEFRIDKKMKYGSITGGISYIIFLVLSLMFILKSFFDYVTFTESRIIYIDKSKMNTPKLNYQLKNFSYAIQISLENGTVLKDTIFSDLFIVEHNFVFFNKTNDNNKLKVKSSVRDCIKTDFYNMSDNFGIFNRSKISDFSCFDFYKNYTLKGLFTDDYMSYGEILIRINPKFLDKNNFFADHNNNTKEYYDYENLINIFTNNCFKYTLYYIDTFYDIDNMEKPLFFKLDATYSYLDLDSYKKTNLFFQELRYSLDKNLFYQNYKREKSMKLYKIEEIDFAMKNRLNSNLDEKSYLSKYYIRSINNYKFVKVSFVKIPEFLASLSGLLFNGLIILNYILNYFNSLEAKQKIINKIMKYKDVIKTNNSKSLEYLSTKFCDDNFKTRIIKSNISRIRENPKKFSFEFENYKFKLTNEKQYNNLEINENNYLSGQKKISNPINEIDFENIYRKDNKLKKDVNYNKLLSIGNFNNSINDIENLKEKLQPNGNLNDLNIKNKNYQNISRDVFPNNQCNSNSFIDKTINEESNKNVNKSKNPYEIYFCDILFRILCCRSLNKKHKLFENAEKKFNHNLDLVTYMKKIQELDILKYLLLDKNTLELVKFISKPCVSMSTKGIDDPEYKLFFETYNDSNTLNYQNIDNVKKSYDAILAKQEKTYLENRILRLTELQIDEIIQ